MFSALLAENIKNNLTLRSLRLCGEDFFFFRTWVKFLFHSHQHEQTILHHIPINFYLLHNNCCINGHVCNRTDKQQGR